jgi:hypothetical protein
VKKNRERRREAGSHARGASRWEQCSCAGTNQGGILGQAATVGVRMSTSG